jgi:hypothetical protein
MPGFNPGFFLHGRTCVCLAFIVPFGNQKLGATTSGTVDNLCTSKNSVEGRSMSAEKFEARVKEITGWIAAQPLDADLMTALNQQFPADSEQFKSLRASVEKGVLEGRLCAEEAGGVRYGRALAATEQTAGFSVDVVLMNDVVGPYHRHPNGEIDMIMPIDPEARFDGHGAGWVVYGPESAHRPTVAGGAAYVLYLLPNGAIDFSKPPADRKEKKQITPERFLSIMKPVLAGVSGKEIKGHLELELNNRFGPDSDSFSRIEQACHEAIAAGWMCAEGEPPRRYGRVIESSEESYGLSIDVVDLTDVVGPHHRHAKGEICLVMPVTEDAKFDGKGAGWKVYEPGSAHRPTVTDGEAIVLYLLPDGEIEFTGE